MDSKFSHSPYQQQTGVVLRQVAGEFMLVPTVTREVDMDSLFLLNASGAWMWQQFASPTTLGELAGQLAARYGIANAQAAADAAAFANQLLERNLLVAAPAS